MILLTVCFYCLCLQTLISLDVWSLEIVNCKILSLKKRSSSLMSVLSSQIYMYFWYLFVFSGSCCESELFVVLLFPIPYPARWNARTQRVSQTCSIFVETFEYKLAKLSILCLKKGGRR